MKDKIPKLDDLSAEDIGRMMKEGSERRRADGEDRRTLRGKHAPPVGKCRVCGGRVVGEVGFDHGGRIGGPPVQGHVRRWSCEGCSVVYARCPEVKP